MLVAACLAAISRAVTRGPREDVLTGLAALVSGVYCRVLHRLRVEGRENIPESREGGLLIVANHTAGVDPLVIQAALPFYVRWMMMESMMIPALRGLWEWLDVIPVAGSGRELASARAAMRAVAAGSAVGIFPEGGIERPARTLLPFIPGVGLIIAKTGAPVLPIVIEGTPPADSAWGSLIKPSRARVRIMPVIRYAPGEMKPDEIARDLERRYAGWTGWPQGAPRSRRAAGAGAAPGSDRGV